MSGRRMFFANTEQAGTATINTDLLYIMKPSGDVTDIPMQHVHDLTLSLSLCLCLGREGEGEGEAREVSLIPAASTRRRRGIGFA